MWFLVALYKNEILETTIYTIHKIYIYMKSLSVCGVVYIVINYTFVGISALRSQIYIYCSSLNVLST